MRSAPIKYYLYFSKDFFFAKSVLDFEKQVLTILSLISSLLTVSPTIQIPQSNSFPAVTSAIKLHFRYVVGFWPTNPIFPKVMLAHSLAIAQAKLFSSDSISLSVIKLSATLLARQLTCPSSSSDFKASHLSSSILNL